MITVNATELLAVEAPRERVRLGHHHFKARDLLAKKVAGSSM